MVIISRAAVPTCPSSRRGGVLVGKKKMEFLIWGVQKQFEGGLAGASRVAERAKGMRRRISPNEIGLYSWNEQKRRDPSQSATERKRCPMFVCGLYQVFGYRIIFRMYTKPARSKEKQKKRFRQRVFLVRRPNGATLVTVQRLTRTTGGGRKDTLATTCSLGSYSPFYCPCVERR